MMVVVKRLYGGGAPITGTNVYTVPASTTTLVKALTICNTRANDQTVTIYFANVAVIYEHVIKGKDTLTIPFFDQIMNAGESINIRSSEATTSIYISGKEVT